MKNISFRLSEEDFAAIEAAAAHEFLPVAAFLRKLALEHARKLGVLNRQTANNPAVQTHAKPTAPMPDGLHAREALLKRIESGEQLRDVAAAANIQVSELQARVSKAKAARADGSLDKALALSAFLRDTPMPDDGREYTPAYFDGAYEWKVVVIADPTATPPEPSRELTLDELTEANDEKYRKLMLAQEGTPVQVAPRINTTASVELDDLFS